METELRAWFTSNELPLLLAPNDARHLLRCGIWFTKHNDGANLLQRSELSRCEQFAPLLRQIAIVLVAQHGPVPQTQQEQKLQRDRENEILSRILKTTSRCIHLGWHFSFSKCWLQTERDMMCRDMKRRTKKRILLWPVLLLLEQKYWLMQDLKGKHGFCHETSVHAWYLSLFFTPLRAGISTLSSSRRTN